MGLCFVASTWGEGISFTRTHSTHTHTLTKMKISIDIFTQKLYIMFLYEKSFGGTYA